MHEVAIQKMESEILIKEAEAKKHKAEAQTREAKAIAWETECYAQTSRIVQIDRFLVCDYLTQ